MSQPEEEVPEDAYMTEAQRERHLVALRAEFGITDQEFLRRAERGEMVHNASQHIWLILLNRGDLIPR